MSATGTITVLPNSTVSVASSSPSLCMNGSLAPIIHLTKGVSGLGAVSGLPTGVNAVWSKDTLSIIGSPTEMGIFNYNISFSGGCGILSAIGQITVLPSSTVSSPSSSSVLCINSNLSPIIHHTLGVTGISTPTNLPKGVTAIWKNDSLIISGTPTQSGTFNYTIPLTGSCGNGAAKGVITVIETAGSVSLSTMDLCINTVLTPVKHVLSGVTGSGSTNGLPSGVSATWSSDTLVISGAPTQSGIFNYSISTPLICGNFILSGEINVKDVSTVSVASASPSLCINASLTPVTHNTSGITGIGTASGLPSGVKVDWTSNILTISGTPTQSGTFNYSIPLTGSCGSAVATGTISVNSSMSVSPATETPTLCINTELIPVIHTTSGANGIDTSNVGLPKGVTAIWKNDTITISGVPSQGGDFKYSIPLTGGCSLISAIGAINVKLNDCDHNVIISSAFTPDADGVNDTWDIHNISLLYPDCDIYIYNRWGNLIFESFNGTYESFPWDGKVLNEDVPIGSYFYIIDTNNAEDKKIQGIVSVIR